MSYEIFNNELSRYMFSKIKVIFTAIIVGTLISYTFQGLIDIFGNPLFFVVLQLITNIIVVYLIQKYFINHLRDVFTENSDIPQGILFWLFLFAVQPLMFDTINTSLRAFYYKFFKRLG